MNPIVQQLNNPLINGIRNGSINPRQKVLEIISGMTPEQRHHLCTMSPMFKNVAKRFNLDPNGVDNILQDIERGNLYG